MTSMLPVVVTKMSPYGAGFVHRRDLVAFHRGLERVDRIDLGDDDARAEALGGLHAALADIAVAGDDDDLARDHHVGRALDRVDERFAAAVEIVELALGARVVDVERGHLERALLDALVEAVHAGRRFLGEAVDAGDQLRDICRGPCWSGRRRHRGSC